PLLSPGSVSGAGYQAVSNAIYQIQHDPLYQLFKPINRLPDVGRLYDIEV
ncbi:11058_t:CDS:1, partial [Funneliformis mosseae]